MKKLLLLGALLAGGTLGFQDVAAAHGGTYRGPGDTVPPGGGGGGGGGAPSAPGPAGPSSGAPSAPGTPGPSTPGAPAGKPAGATAAVTQGGPSGPDLTVWQFWWGFNREPYLNLRSKIHSGAVATGSDSFFLGKGQKEQAKNSLRPSEAEIRSNVVPALIKALENEKNNDILTGSMIALAKIGDAKDENGQSAFEQIIKKFLSDGVQEVSETAALSLGILANEASTPTLVSLMKDQPEGRKLVGSNEVPYRTRAFAAYGLGLIGYRTSDNALKQDICEHLIDVLNMQHFATRDIKVAALTAFGLTPIDVVDDPAAALEGVEEGSNRRHVVSRQAQLAFLEDYFDPDKQRANDTTRHWFVRAHAPVAMARLLNEAPEDLKGPVTDVLLKASGRHSKEQREIIQSCTVALGMIGDADNGKEDVDSTIRSELMRLAKEGEEQVKRFALIALAQSNSRAGQGEAPYGGLEEARAELLKQMSRGKTQLKPWAALSLGVMGVRTTPTSRRSRWASAARRWRTASPTARASARRRGDPNSSSTCATRTCSTTPSPRSSARTHTSATSTARTSIGGCAPTWRRSRRASTGVTPTASKTSASISQPSARASRTTRRATTSRRKSSEARRGGPVQGGEDPLPDVTRAARATQATRAARGLRRSAARLALVAMLAYLPFNHCHFSSSDEEGVYRTALMLWEHGTLALDRNLPHTFVGPDGGRYSHFALGQVALAMPLLVVGALADALVPDGLVRVMAEREVSFLDTEEDPKTFFVSAYAPIVSGLLVGLFYWFQRRLGVAQPAATAATALLAASTYVATMSVFFLRHTTESLLVFAAIVAWHEWRRGASQRWLFAGAICASAIPLVRVPAAVAGLPLGAYLLFCIADRWRREPALRARAASLVAAVGLPLAVAALGYVASNQVRWGTWLHSPMVAQQPLLRGSLAAGLHGLLLSPGASLFAYSPPALLGVFALAAGARRERALRGVIVGVCVAFLVLCGSFVFWHGLWSAPGPRYLVALVPLLMVPVGPWLDAGARGAWAAAALLGVVGCAIQLPLAMAQWRNTVALMDYMAEAATLDFLFDVARGPIVGCARAVAQGEIDVYLFALARGVPGREPQLAIALVLAVLWLCAFVPALRALRRALAAE